MAWLSYRGALDLPDTLPCPCGEKHFTGKTRRYMFQSASNVFWLRVMQKKLKVSCTLFVSFPWILLCGYTPKWYASGKEEISSNMVVCSVVAVKRGWRCKWKVKGEKVVCDGCDMIIFLLFMRLFINNTRRKGTELTHVSYTPSLVFITGLSTRKKHKRNNIFS